jgi:protocatechuate 3,4-dioxygenase beta subunit
MSMSAPNDGDRDGLSRRRWLGLMGTAGAASLAGRGAAAESPDGAVPTIPLHRMDCIVTPAQTEGPYFVDERLHRSDLRSDPSNQSVKEGWPLRLRMQVTRVQGNACTPVEGALVDIWQCDALGVYSDVRDFQGRFDTRGQKFLRGYQLTDRSGYADFLTIYPGWYEGRTVHIHFKVRLFEGEQRSFEFTSQLYFEEAVTDEVYKHAPYAAKGPPDTRNSRDGIYRAGNSGSFLMLKTAREGNGHTGTMAIGLRMS